MAQLSFLGVPYSSELVFHRVYSDAVVDAAGIREPDDRVMVRAAATTAFATMTRLKLTKMRRLVSTAFSGTFLVTVTSSAA